MDGYTAGPKQPYRERSELGSGSGNSQLGTLPSPSSARPNDCVHTGIQATRPSGVSLMLFAPSLFIGRDVTLCRTLGLWLAAALIQREAGVEWCCETNPGTNQLGAFNLISHRRGERQAAHHHKARTGNHQQEARFTFRFIQSGGTSHPLTAQP
jgi:hypothetical protein